MNRLLMTMACGAIYLLGFTTAAIADNESGGPRVVETKSGLKISIHKEGERGKEGRHSDVAKVHYTGKFLDGRTFDTSRKQGGKPFQFQIGSGQVIKGWDEALKHLAPGSRAKVFVPSAMAYGAKGHQAGIPPNTDLNFDIEVIEIIQTPRFRAPDSAAQQTTKTGLKYEVIEPGEGANPQPTQAVRASFALWNTKGEMVICTEASGMKCAGAMTGQPSPKIGPIEQKFMTEALALMRPGAVYLFEVPPALCWGDKPVARNLPANSTTIWRLSLERIFDMPQFAQANADATKTTSTGLKYEVLKEGAGASPQKHDRVTVHYTGWLQDGRVFDSSHARGEPSTFFLNRVIDGWTEGVQLMKPGGVYRFTIPAALAYGDNPRPGGLIKPGATLVFLIELVKVG